MSWLKRILLFLGIVLLLRLLVVDLYFVPTDSMENSIAAGSYILVSKGGYGAKLPRTLREIPWVSRVARWSGWNTSLWTNTRLPGWGEINRLDAVLSELDGMKIIKRIVGMPGDYIRVVDGHCYLNGAPAAEPAGIQFTKTISAEDGKLLSQVREASIVSWEYLGGKTFKVTADEAYFSSISAWPELAVASVEQDMDASEEAGIYPKHKRGEWDRNNYGELAIPHQGMTLILNKENWSTYCWTIDKYEDVKVDCNQLDPPYMVDEQAVDKYVFSKNYFFLMGDNRMESIDSRFVGFFPEDLLFGRVSYVF